MAVSDADLVRVHSPLMSPLVWDLGRIAAFEDLWLVHRYGGRPLLRAELAAVYDAFETPRAGRGALPFLGPAEAFGYLESVRERTLEVLAARGAGDGSLLELTVRHEMQHNETMLQTIQLARLEGYELRGGAGSCCQHPRVAPKRGGHPGSELTWLELVEIPAGACTIGTAGGVFAYDNERPRHRRDVPGYLIGRSAVTNAACLDFVEAGGYERRECWSQGGWAWKERHGITMPGGWTADHTAEWRLCGLVPIDRQRPVVHVSWFEADAFARAHGARLPTETEWEKAAAWDPQLGAARSLERGRCPGVRSLRSPAFTPTWITMRWGPRGGRAPRWRLCVRLPGDDRRCLGVDCEQLRRLPGVRGRTVPRVLGGVLRGRVPGTARRLVGYPRAGDLPHVPQLGLPAAAPDLHRLADRDRRVR